MDVPNLPFSGQMALVIGPHAVQVQMLDLAARLAVSGPLRVFDCGNRFNVYPVARAIRSRTAALQAALERIHLARAFTCYQVLALLEEAPEEGVPTLVLDLLSTFYDGDVKLPESQRLLRRSLLQLRRLSRAAPLIVSAQPPKPIVYAERSGLLDSLRQAAHVLWEADPTPLPPGAIQGDFLLALEEPADSPVTRPSHFSPSAAPLAGQPTAVESPPAPLAAAGPVPPPLDLIQGDIWAVEQPKYPPDKTSSGVWPFSQVGADLTPNPLCHGHAARSTSVERGLKKEKGIFGRFGDQKTPLFFSPPRFWGRGQGKPQVLVLGKPQVLVLGKPQVLVLGWGLVFGAFFKKGQTPGAGG